MPGYFRSLTDVQIFCNEEIKKSHEKFSATLTKTVTLIAAAVPAEKVEEGELQLRQLNQDIETRLCVLRQKKESEPIPVGVKQDDPGQTADS
jgi:hypothetical protein